MCAFISSDLAEGEHVYTKAPPDYDIGEGNCLSMNKCIYGHIQAPRQYYLLCREVYGRSDLQCLHTDECVFVRYVSNIKIQPQLTNENLLINGKFLNMEFVPDKMQVYKSCSHPVAAILLVMYVDNNSIRHNCEELVQESACEGKASLTSAFRSDIHTVSSQVQFLPTFIVSSSSKAWNMPTLASCP